MNTLVPHNEQPEVQSSLNEVTLGQWYYVKDTYRLSDKEAGIKKGDTYEWFGCVMHIGSNYIELHSAHGTGHSYSDIRVHFDEFWDRLRFEPNPNSVIKDNVAYYQSESKRLLQEVQNVTESLGLQSITSLTHTQEGNSKALVTLSSQPDIKSYEIALKKAKDETLPELFQAIKDNNEQLAKWMLAETMTTQAMIKPMEESIEHIKDRIFNVSLYAGLTEDAVKCCEGKPATMDDKLHVMQRRLYMDEECLLNYKAGGMAFDDIEEFDKWISKPVNRDRILPFPRTLVAMMVRRNVKERDHDGSLLKAFINFQIAQSDKYTFLYVRNGEQVWRIGTEIDFGELIFPDSTVFNPLEPKMVKMFNDRVDRIISLSHYEDLVKEYEAWKIKHDQWTKDHPEAHSMDNPHRWERSWDFRPNDYNPFNKTNVYYDDIMKTIEKEIKEYNRIALIIQGLFDRSQVLHPHAPVKSWVTEGFEKAIKLVYDGTMILNNGEAPDFEAYREECNKSLNAESIVTGQQDYWERKEAAKENKRLDTDWRNKSDYRHIRFKPYGNPGPGVVGRMSGWQKRGRKATFSWERDRMRRGYYDDETVKCTVTVPENCLFNISGYKKGDYKRFFQDSRTRAQYLKWAPLLLTAEDYLAGKKKIGE